MQPHRGIVIDERWAPLVVMRVGHTIARPDMDAWLGALDALLDRGPFASVVLVRQRGELDRAVMSQYGEFARAHRARMERVWLGSAFVLPQPVLRFILAGVLLAAPTAVPHDVFGEAQPGARWCAERLRARGADVPIPSEQDLWGPLGPPG